ncbi:MAG: tRNA (N6-isopentenyl adenosine(37)-C2)-methylthiotransferase MiaB [Alphaproteobacteria bacterium]
MAKKLFIQTYGCQMNVYDSARMADVLAAEGYEPVSEAADADLVILNTCHIREKAAEKVYSTLGRLRQLRQEARTRGRDMTIGVGGCVAQAEGEEMVRRAPVVDIVFGPQTYHRLPDMLARARDGGPVVETDFATRPKFDALGATPQAGAVAAFLSVQEGCDKFCTFCVVPYTRGAEYSRPAAQVLAEARTLVRRGAREITLLGQNVNAYHGAAAAGHRTWSLARLIRALAEIDGLDRIRYTTSHPRDMDDDLIAAHRDVPQLAPYLHLPVQSGSDRILAAMNRRHSVAEYLRIVDRLRAARPDIALSSDFIVGFPGEAEKDFEATLDLARTVAPAAAFSFAYSARPGTPAAESADQIPEGEKSERLQRLQDVLAGSARAFNAACVGRCLDVLFDKPGRHPGQAGGRSPYLQAVHVECGDDDAARALIGTLRPVTIAAASANSLTGTLASDAADVMRPGSEAPPMPTGSVPA